MTERQAETILTPQDRAFGIGQHVPQYDAWQEPAVKQANVIRMLDRFHTQPRPVVPASSLEDTVEVAKLRRMNDRIDWATESTGLLRVLRWGLAALDRPDAEQEAEQCLG